MDWYLMVWKKFAEFDGRARRTEYWMFTLFNLLAMLVLAAVGGVGLAISQDYGGVLFIPLGIYVLAQIIPGLAVAVRRFHDTGKSGWMILLFMVLGIIPLVGLIASIVQIVFLCTDSDPGANEYGPNPKFPELADGMIPAYSGASMFGLSPQPQAQPLAIENTQRPCTRCGATTDGTSSICASCGAQI